MRSLFGHRRLGVLGQWVSVAVVVAGFVATPAIGDSRSVTVRPGLIELKVEANNGVDVSWEARDPIDLEYKTFDASRVVVFCKHTPGRVVIVSDVIDWEARQRVKTTWLVTVEGDAPGPEPNPNPPEPPSRFGLDKVAREALSSVPVAARVIAPTLASNFESVASAIAAGGVRDVEGALKLVSERNRATFGTHRESWESWLETVGFAVDRMQDAGQIKTVNDYGAVLSEIASGLRVARF